MSSPTPPDPKLLPMHSLPTDPSLGQIRRRPGRPRRARPAPVFDENDYNAKLDEQRQQHLAKDPVLSALTRRDDGMEVVHRSLLALAQEAASLRFARERGELEGKDISVTASRRIDALSKMATLLLAVQKLGATELVASPATIKRVTALWVRHVGALVHQLLPPDEATKLMAAYESRLRSDSELGGVTTSDVE